MRASAILALALSSSPAIAEPADKNQLRLPLAGRANAVTIPLLHGMTLAARPHQEGWEIAVAESGSKDESPNLLYHSRQWHGPYPSQVYAWHVQQHYFPDTRWLCVAGHPIEVKLQILNAKVKPSGETAVFERGQLHIEWFYRPCSKGFGYDNASAAPSPRPDSDKPKPH